MQQNDGFTTENSTNLLLSIAHQLKLPLNNIARQAELGQLTGKFELDELGHIRVHAMAALSLVDSYLLGLHLMTQQTSLDLEPVSVSSTLVETAHELHNFAKQYNVGLDLRVAGKFEPVMANRMGLKSALLSIGYTLVEAQISDERDPSRLTLAAYRMAQGRIAAGLYGKHQDLSEASWRRALDLCGQVRQPIVALSAGSGAGIFVADAILQAMDTRLRVGHHRKQTGLGTTLQTSRQLQFV